MIESTWKVYLKIACKHLANKTQLSLPLNSFSGCSDLQIQKCALTPCSLLVGFCHTSALACWIQTSIKSARSWFIGGLEWRLQQSRRVGCDARKKRAQDTFHQFSTIKHITKEQTCVATIQLKQPHQIAKQNCDHSPTVVALLQHAAESRSTVHIVCT